MNMKKAFFANLIGAGCLCCLLLAATAQETPTTSAAPSGKNPIGSLVAVSVRGTKVDILPQHVDVIVDDPEQAVSQAVKLGATKPLKDAPMIIYKRVSYQFSKPDEWNWQLTGVKAKAGDVFYSFDVESVKERTAFLLRYGLRKEVGSMGEKNGAKTAILEASPGFYVFVLTPTSVYSCATCEITDGKAEQEVPGKCPKCEKALVETKTYR